MNERCAAVATVRRHISLLAERPIGKGHIHDQEFEVAPREEERRIGVGPEFAEVVESPRDGQSDAIGRLVQLECHAEQSPQRGVARRGGQLAFHDRSRFRKRLPRGGEVAIGPLDRSQPDEQPQHPEGVKADLGMRCALLAAKPEGTLVNRQSPGDTPKVHELLTEIFEVIGEISSVLFNPVRLFNGQLLFGHGLLERGNRLGVSPSVVVQAAEVVPAQAELAVITRLVGLRLNQSLEDVDGPLD